MSRFLFTLLAIVLLVLVTSAPRSRAAGMSGTPDFKEVYDLVRTHLAGTSEAELNHAAVEGLLASLRGKVSLVECVPPSTNTTLVSKTSMLDDGVAYVRVGRVGDGLANEVSVAHQQLSATNKLKGLALDLRFADGDNYAAAVAVADLFTAKERALLDWGNGVMKSTVKTDALSLPLAVLVNRETGGAAEALAAMLRETGAGLILGGVTAGRAMITQEYSLKDGQRLRIATSPVKLGDGTALSAQGLKPDIVVAVGADDERLFFKDAYAVLPGVNLLVGTELLLANSPSGTNRPARQPRLTEAELVREQREGATGNLEPAPVREAEPEKPLIHDPALARAVDLLKGLAVVRQSHS
jgi:hypothetical protein